MTEVVKENAKLLAVVIALITIGSAIAAWGAGRAKVRSDIEAIATSISTHAAKAAHAGAAEAIAEATEQRAAASVERTEIKGDLKEIKAQQRASNDLLEKIWNKLEKMEER